MYLPYAYYDRTTCNITIKKHVVGNLLLGGSSNMILNLVVVVAFALFIFVSYTFQSSFAKTNNDDREDKEKNEEIFYSFKNKNETFNDNLIELNIQSNYSTNTLNDNYPDQYYVCGYPKHLITNYIFLEKLDCD